MVEFDYRTELQNYCSVTQYTASWWFAATGQLQKGSHWGISAVHSVCYYRSAIEGQSQKDNRCSFCLLLSVIYRRPATEGYQLFILFAATGQLQKASHRRISAVHSVCCYRSATEGQPQKDISCSFCLLLPVSYRRPATEGYQLFTLFAAQKGAFRIKGVKLVWLVGWLDPMNEFLWIFLSLGRNPRLDIQNEVGYFPRNFLYHIPPGMTSCYMSTRYKQLF